MDLSQVFSNMNENNENLGLSDNDQEENSQALLLPSNPEDQKPSSRHVSPNASLPNAKRQKLTDDDIKNKSQLDPHVLHLFPFQGVDTIVAESFEIDRKDPRGWIPRFNETMPKSFCKHCKCSQKRCHDNRFGLYCGLRVAEETKKIGQGKLYGFKIDEIFEKAYNEVLRVTTVMEIGYLDTHSKYKVPECMKTKTWLNIMRHFYYEKFSNRMEARLCDGSHGLAGNGTFSFFNALRREPEKKK